MDAQQPMRFQQIYARIRPVSFLFMLNDVLMAEQMGKKANILRLKTLMRYIATNAHPLILLVSSGFSQKIDVDQGQSTTSFSIKNEVSSNTVSVENVRTSAHGPFCSTIIWIDPTSNPGCLSGRAWLFKSWKRDCLMQTRIKLYLHQNDNMPMILQLSSCSSKAQVSSSFSCCIAQGSKLCQVCITTVQHSTGSASLHLNLAL